MMPFDLERYGIHVRPVLRNPAPALLIERALAFEGAQLTDAGALATRSGAKTGRSPQDKRVVDHPASRDDIWWGNINIRLTEESFNVNHQRAVDYLNTRDYVYVIDGYAGWDPKYRIKVRVICSLAYHALFMHNMLIRPTAEELEQFGEPDLTIINSGQFPANLLTKGMDSGTSIDLSFEQRTIIILGTMYAGEMKKGVFTVMHYLMPKMGVFSMHCSANEGPAGDVTLFFGLSGTGKTTLSADPHRRLIGDDEHCWSDDGVFNIEGGCYAKCVNLSEQKEPEIWRAIRFGALLENVVVDPASRRPDYTDISITENTRVSYPIEYIDHAKIPCTGGHPKNVIFLTCDAFGVLPPVARLTPAQAMYHFMSGYTAKVAGTEVGITEPKAAFSTCFSAPFLVLHPSHYAEMLAAKLQQYQAQAWLINTGWSGGAYGVGQRIALPYTRAIIDAIHDGSLLQAPTVVDDVFGLHIPVEVRGVPSQILLPRQTWADPSAFDRQVAYLAGLFTANFRRYEKGTSPEILAAGPRP